jgi:hypothetical protein
MLVSGHSAQTTGEFSGEAIIDWAETESCVRQNRVVLASAADAKLAEVTSAQPGPASLNPSATVTKTLVAGESTA